MEIEQNISQDHEEKEVLERLLEKCGKQLFFMRIFAAAAVGLFLIFFILALVLVPRIVTVLADVDMLMRETGELVEETDGLMESAEDALADISQMSTEVTNVSTEMSSFLTQNAEALSDVASNISEIDFEGLNAAIQDLQDAVGPFANLMNRFK